MGQADWKELSGALTPASLSRGVTGAVAGPAGSNGFVMAYNSLNATVSGAHGWLVDLTGYNPTGSGPSIADGGGSIRGCVKRVESPNATGMSPFLFSCVQGGSSPTVNDYAYLLGLSDNTPYQIVLAKAPIVSGLRVDEENVSILRSSSAQFNIGDGLWHHLRLDAIVQTNGDVLLQCFSNDLTTRPVGTTPSWQPITGMDDFIDDLNQINTGTPPLLGGSHGFAFAVHESLNRRGAFDAIQLERQT